MTDLENKAFAFLQVHTLYDKCKGKHYRDKSDFELMAEFAQKQTDNLSKQIQRAYELGKSELEKENAELKKQLEHRNCVDCSNHGSNIKLLKAKEIIKNLLFLHNDKFGSTRLEWRCNVVAEAEQFLKENA